MLSKLTATPKKATTLPSKWSKHKFLLKHSRLRQFMPDTKVYSYENLQTMLGKHRMVYVKPIKGTGGNGVIKVVKVDKQKYGYHAGNVPRYYTSYSSLYHALNNSRLKREYIVQQGIKLLTYQNRIFDIRVMSQLNEKNTWECTGYIGRVAHPAKIVTNFHSSGKPLPLEQLLSPYLQGKKKDQFIAALKDLGNQVAKEFHKKYRGVKEVGLDIGLDSEFKPWIIEVNTRPDAYIFNQLKNKRMFRRVIYLKKWHGLIRSGK